MPISSQDHYIDIPGGRIFARVWSAEHFPSGASPVLLLHDSLGCVDLWRGFPQALARALNRRIIAYDREGHGRSTPRSSRPATDFVADEAARIFPILREALDFTTFGLLGHSVGGGMAVHMAARYPDDCVALITEGSQAFVEDRTLQGIRAAKGYFSGPGRMRRLEALHGDKATQVLEAWTEVWLSGEFADWNLFDVLPRVTCPLLAIHGDRDEYGSVAFPRELVARSGGSARALILPGCGHTPHLEDPDTVIAAIHDLFVGLLPAEVSSAALP